jgi:putative restriction endonuclease
MQLAAYADRFARLNVGSVGSHERPHKPVMLLALLDLFAQGTIKENRITYSPELLELFAEYFEAVREEGDQLTPINPFFYLRGDGFWHHHPRAGREMVLSALKAPPGVRAFQEISDYVALDDELFEILQDHAGRSALRDVLISRYFAPKRGQVGTIAQRESKIADYQRRLDEGGRVAESADVPEAVRNTAFSRIVRRAYDYRCAACGLRVVLGGGIYIVDAAHLIPFATSHDDDPCNGIALCKNHHWAMDRNLIAPTTERTWQVLPTLDDRLEGQRDLILLKGRSILLPHEPRYHPKAGALLWRERELARESRLP